MRLFLIPAVAALLALAAGRPAFAATAPAATAEDKGKKNGDDDKNGKKGDGKKGKKDEGRGDKLPKAVAGAVKSIFPGMTVVKVEEEDEDGDVVYEVRLRGKGGTLEAKLTPKGRVVEVELKGGEDDEGEKGKKGEGDTKKDEKGKKKGDDKDERKGKGEKGKKKGDRD